jgi:cellulose synthase/poly-beta-1,6-N-acetylglucosamine synthase-like glycosyltransferase
MALPVIILLIVVYGYTLLILLFYLEIDKDPDHGDSPMEYSRSISVIVPFKNEAVYLKGLLEDFSKQSYPAELLEVIFVDDHSMDGSAAILASMIGDWEHFSQLSLPPGLSGKKKALAHGVQHAKYEWIVQVDADCRLSRGFISAHATFLEKQPSDLVAGIVNTGTGKGNFLEIFERLDILSLAGSAAGSFSLGRPMICSGANLSYSKKLYRETRNFDPETSIASGDDMFLMIGARKLGRTLSFNTLREAMVTTAPVKDWRSLINQRIRWGSKTGRYGMPDIQLLALLVTLANISILLMPLWAILFPFLWPWLAGSYFVKTLADFMLLYRITGISGSRKSLKMFLPVSLLYYPYFIVSVLGALRGKYAWKAETK